MNPLIREANAADAAAVSRLITDLGYEMDADGVRSRFVAYSTATSKVWVAEQSLHVVGFLSFHVIPLFHASNDLGRITAMAIASSHQRRGIGRSLLERAEEFAWRAGCVRIEVTSGDHREGKAHRFYESAGYVLNCRRFLKTRPSGTGHPEGRNDFPAAAPQSTQ